MALTKSTATEYSVSVSLTIPQSDMQFYIDVQRRMGNIACMKVLRLAYPLLTLSQANDLSGEIREMFKEQIQHA